MYRYIADKIASVTKNVPIGKEIRVDPSVAAEAGYIIAGKIRGEKSTYNTVENCEGRMVRLHRGDILVGALGHRNALHGYSGVIPETVEAGSILHVLNLGGVIGQCTSVNPEVGSPFEFEVLGSVLTFPEFGSRSGVPAHVKMNALTARTSIEQAPEVPVIFIIGTSMNSGKTLASAQITRELANRGKKVAASKLTGVSLLKDTLAMKDYGALWSASFNDVGIVTTGADTSVPAAREVLSYLSSVGAEVIIAELGDGIMGQYGVQEILSDRKLISRAACIVLCANDPVGAWGAVQLLKEEFGIKPDIITGPTTDNEAGIKAIASKVGIPAINARMNGAELSKKIARIVFDE